MKDYKDQKQRNLMERFHSLLDHLDPTKTPKVEDNKKKTNEELLKEFHALSDHLE